MARATRASLQTLASRYGYQCSQLSARNPSRGFLFRQPCPGDIRHPAEFVLTGSVSSRILEACYLPAGRTSDGKNLPGIGGVRAVRGLASPFRPRPPHQMHLAFFEAMALAALEGKKI